MCRCGWGNGGAVPGVPGAFPQWMGPYTVTHTQLQAAALENDISLASATPAPGFTLPAFGHIHGHILKHDALFAGGALTGYFLSLGIAGSAITLQSIMNEYDVFGTAVAADNFAMGENHRAFSVTATQAIRIRARSTGANLSASTGGTCRIWFLVSVPGV